MTEQQQKFLDALFGEARGNYVEAKKIAGYAKTTNMSDITDSLGEDIIKRVQAMLAKQGVMAAFAIQDILENPTELGNRDKLAAAKDILDRGGFKAKDRVEVTGEGAAVWVAPLKKKDDDEDAEGEDSKNY